MSLPPRTGAIRVANCGLPEPHRIANSPLSSGPADFPASPSKRCSAIVQWLSGSWYGLFHRPALKTADERGRMLSGQTANTTVVRTKTAAGTASAFGSYRPEQSSHSLYHGISIRSAILTARSVTSCCCTVARDWPVSGAKAALLNCGI